MVEKSKKRISARQVQLITNRLYQGKGSKQEKKEELSNKKKYNKKEVDNIVERLYDKDYLLKKIEFTKKHYHEQPQKYGYQKKNYGEIIEITERLYSQSNSGNTKPKQSSTTYPKKLAKNEDVEEIVNRLFVFNPYEKNYIKQRDFYNNILKQKKSNEKPMTIEQKHEMIERLARVSKCPPESNKELQGKQAYERFGIVSTYIFNKRRKREPVIPRPSIEQPF